MGATEGQGECQMTKKLGVTGISCRSKSGEQLSPEVERACVEEISRIQRDRVAAAQGSKGRRDQTPSAE